MLPLMYIQIHSIGHWPPRAAVQNRDLEKKMMLNRVNRVKQESKGEKVQVVRGRIVREKMRSGKIGVVSRLRRVEGFVA